MATPVQVPNMNPTGVIGSGYGNTPMMGQGGTPFSGTGGPGTMGHGNSANPNPSMTSGNPFMSTAMSSKPYSPQPATVTGNPGGQGGTTGTTTSEGSTTQSGNPYGQSQSQQNWTEKYLQETYGGGMGSLIYQYLMSNGGYNSGVTQQTVDATTNAMQRQTQLGANALESSLSSMGISGGSSSMGDAVGAYENQATATENQITAQDYYNMWNQSQQNEMNMMEFAAGGTAKTLANKPNWMDYADMGISLAGVLV
jgi:hypothetical protein